MAAKKSPMFDEPENTTDAAATATLDPPAETATTEPAPEPARVPRIGETVYLNHVTGSMSASENGPVWRSVRQTEAVRVVRVDPATLVLDVERSLPEIHRECCPALPEHTARRLIGRWAQTNADNVLVTERSATKPSNSENVWLFLQTPTAVEPVQGRVVNDYTESGDMIVVDDLLDIEIVDTEIWPNVPFAGDLGQPANRTWSFSPAPPVDPAST